MIPELVQHGIGEYRTYGKLSLWYRASHADRKSVDTWLVEIKHPLAYEAGTAEYRYQTIVKELS